MDLIDRIILVDKILHTFPFYEKKVDILHFYTNISQMKKKLCKKNGVQ